MHAFRPVFAVLAAATALLVACDDHSRPDLPTAPPTVSISAVTGAVASLTVGNAIDIGNFGTSAAFTPFINEVGNVAGLMPVPSGSNHVVRWSPGTGLVDLGLPAGCSSIAFEDLNDADQIAGTTDCGEVFSVSTAFRWSPGAGFTRLPPNVTDPVNYSIQAYAHAINNSGEVAGITSAGGQWHAARWDAGGNLTIGSYAPGLTTIHIRPRDINDDGVIVGDLDYANLGVQIGFIWAPGGSVQPLLAFGGRTRVVGITNGGVVYGEAEVSPGGEMHAFRWTGGGAEDLGPGRPLGASDSDEVLLWSTNPPGYSIWTPTGGRQAFPTVPQAPPGHLFLPQGISRNGIVVGSVGILGEENIVYEHAFRWTPVAGYEDLGRLTGTGARGMTVNRAGQVAGLWFGGAEGHRWARWTRPNLPPVPAISAPLDGTEGMAVAFSAAGSTDPEGGALTYEWDFGDATAACAGTTQNGTTGSPTHAYCDDGTYTVTLTVHDAGGASAQASTTAVIANATPQVTAGVGAAVLIDQSVEVTASFTDAGVADGPWSYAIDWQDGTPMATGRLLSQATGVAASHAFAAAGTYVVSIVVTDKDGGIGTATSTVTVRSMNGAPVAVITGPTSFQATVPQTFTATGSSDPDGDALTYAWNMGNGQTFTGPMVSYAYPAQGQYTITLTVTDALGATATATHLISVKPAPKPLTVDVVAASPPVWLGETSLITATVKDPCTGGCTVTARWGNGDVTTHTVPQPVVSGARSTTFTLPHVYGAVGQYTPLGLTVANTSGQSGSATAVGPLRVALRIPVTVNPACAAGTTACVQPKTQLAILIASAPNVPVATLGVSTVTLGDNLGSETKPDRCAVVADRNGDGTQDVVCLFFKSQVSKALAPGATTFYLNATLGDGRPIQGRAPISGL